MSKYLGTLNVNAGDAGDIHFEITDDTPIERVAAVLRFADEMTNAKPVDAEPEPADAPDPPLPAKTKTRRAAKPTVTPSPPKAPFECDECHRRFATANSIKIHKGRIHKPELKSAGAAAADDMGPDADLHRCGECEFVAPVTAFGSGIGAHTRMRHHREPTTGEKSPRTQADVDAAAALAG